MLFTTPLFLFAFLPVLLIAYFLVPSRGRNILLFAASLFFYAWGDISGVIVLLVSIGCNYSFAILIDRFRNGASGKAFLFLSITVNVGLLFAFKYFNFFVESLNAGLHLVSIDPLDHVRIPFPIGISFFTFKALSYVIDVYRERTAVRTNMLHVALYIAFFPHVLAGPIARLQEVAEGLQTRTVDPSLFVSGIQRFVFGIAKKMLIANPLGTVADQIFALPADHVTFGVSWLGAICYTLQIYFDFSGYSDMAIGLGRMFGFTILENFNFPYISSSIREFWRRWHISLSTWFRDYLYIPLGGNRCRPKRVYFNLFIVFFLCGLWHGANWTFVVWGMIHGIFIAAERAGMAHLLSRAWKPFQHFYALVVVTLAWVFFRAENIPAAISYMKAMFGFGIGNSWIYYPGLYLTNDVVIALIAGIMFSAPIYQYVSRTARWSLKVNPLVYVLAQFVVIGLLFLTSMLSVAASTYKPFIYFKF